jgi:hypothetical protein
MNQLLQNIIDVLISLGLMEEVQAIRELVARDEQHREFLDKAEPLLDSIEKGLENIQSTQAWLIRHPVNEED